MAISSPTQDFVVSSGLNVQGTGTVTSSTGNTSTLQVDGGAAIAKNAIIGGTVEIYGDTTIHGNLPYLSVTGTSTLATVTAGYTTATQLDVVTRLTVGGLSQLNNVTVSNPTNSTATTNGALVVTGGVGVGGNIYAGTIYSNGQQVLTSGAGGGFVSSLAGGTDTVVSTATGAVTIWNTSTLQSVTDRGATTDNAITISNTTSATSTNTGALRVYGGVGVGGALYVASTSYINNSRILVAGDLETVTTTATFITNDPTSQVGLVALAGTSTTYGTYNFGDASSIVAFNDYNTGTNTGFYSINDASSAPGYVVYIGFTNVSGFTRLVLNINYTQSSGHTVQIDLYNFQTVGWDSFTTYSGSPSWTQFILETFDSTPYISSGKTYARLNHTSFGNTAHRTWIDYAVLEDSIQGGQGPRGATGATGATGPQGLTTSTTSTFIFFNTTSALSTSSAAVVAYGGVGIGGGLIVGGVTTVTNVSANTATVSGNALQVTGGVGIGGSLFVQGDAVFASPVTFAGSATYVLSTNTLYTDNIIELHTPGGNMDAVWTVDDGKDIGFHLHYYRNGTDTNAALLLRNDSKYLEWFRDGTDSYANGNNFTATIYGTFKTGSIILVDTTASNSTNTGALTVTGGVGIGGALYVNTTSFINGSQILTTATVNQYANQTTITAGTDTAVNTSTGNITIWNTGTLQSVTNRGAVTTNAISVTNTTNSTSTITGAIVVTGGVGIGGNLYAGTIYSNGQPVLTSGAGGGFVSSITAGTDTAVSTSTGAVTIWNTGTLQSVTNRGATTTNAISVTNTASSTSTTTGALKVTGGVGIGGGLYVGLGITATNITLTGLTLNRVPFVSTNGLLTDNANFYVDNANALFYAGGGGAYIGGTGGFGTVASTIALINTATVLGFNARLNVVGPSYLSGSLYVTGVSTLTNTTSATSTTTGALQVAGGVGIGGKLFVGGLANNTSSYIAYYNTTTGELGFGINPVQQTLVALNTASASFYPTFVDSNNSVATSEAFYTTSSFTINPATGNVTVGTTAASLSTSTSTGALQVRGGVGVSDSVYVGNKVGWVNTAGNASVFYQFYNTLTNSLDTVFG